MSIAAAPIEGIRMLTYPPRPGEHYLSINLAMVDDVVKTLDFAVSLGFKPELVQISTRQGTTEIHALLLHETGITKNPLEEEGELSQRIDELADEINQDAIRHTYGRFKAT
jgi:arginyl-tRNA synthetase